VLPAVVSFGQAATAFFLDHFKVVRIAILIIFGRAAAVLRDRCARGRYVQPGN
jgi:hypothetical protein